ncbi:serine hydrolase [Bacillus sp. C1]
MKLLKYKTIFMCLLCNVCIFFLLAPKVSAEKDVKNKIDNYVETFLEEQEVPGASIAIVHENDVFYSNAWGVTGENKEKVTTKTPFTIGSISKSLTGLAIMKLSEEGMIHLEDPVQKYIPWFTLQDKEAASKITIKQLLTHSSGMSTYVGLAISDKGDKGFRAIKENVKSLSNVKLTALPGEKHQYSNANFLILGAVMEELTNQTYSEYMEQQVFAPLGMEHAAANNDASYKNGYVAGYQSWFGTPRKSLVTYDNGGAPYGYITASAEDMVQYIKLLSQQENETFLTKETMNLYTSPYVQTGANRYYGLGIRITNPNSDEKMIWHSGSTPDSHAEVFFIPKTGWGGVILTNKNHIFEEEALLHLKQGIINIVNGEEPSDIPSNIPIVQLVIMWIICLLLIIFVYVIVKLKSRKVLRKSVWFMLGSIFLFLSVVIIPGLIHSTGSPWHAIYVFAPDVAYLVTGVVILLALNGFLFISIACKHKVPNHFSS